ncbi:MAG: ATP-dependent Clp protease ATP-binding subunit [Candidatus Moraniibacteriota bacterium]|nr:MAG: ATP-dependent Clp protease ATP-binding subunit [Candidatus Moranbacteria bacterium]
MNFFLWYYSVGILSIARIAGNYVRYVLHRFNVVGLFRTLISPWKRDISFHTWQGLHPILFVQALANNLITRFLGAIVRSVVLAWGFGAIVLMAVAVIALSLFAALAPLILIGGSVIIGGLFGTFAGIAAFVVAIVVTIVAVLAWHEYERGRIDYTVQPEHAPWRGRAMMRLGLAAKEARAEVIAVPEQRTAFLSAHHLTPELFDLAWAIEGAAYAAKERQSRFWEWTELRQATRIGKYWAYAYTPRLDHYISDLSEHDFSNYAHQELVGREPVMEMLTLTLSRPTDNSALLVGDPGIGKRSLVHAFARRIRENSFTDKIIDEARVVIFDMGQVISDGRSQGIDPKGLLRDLLNGAVYAGNVVLVIENINLFLDPESDMAVSDVLNDYLSLPTCRIIGLMTAEAYHTLGQRQIPALKYFEAIQVPEPTQEETITILVDTFKTLEKNRPVFTIQALQAIVDGSERYNWEMPFPERAIDLAQEVLIYWEKHPDLAFIERTTVEDFLEAKSGIPMGEANEEERQKLLNLEALLHERVIGQEEAIKQMSEAFRKARAGLGNDKKPIGSFLFLGPTGVGKTETAKALAAVYFGDENRMVRLDMSEFQTPQSIDELIGSAEMNVQGRMTSLIKERPYSILLLDELEKAYPRALDLFLQILDEGYVTDGFGHKVNFRNTIVIATSNAGADMIHEATGAGRSMVEIKDELMDAIIAKGTFRPEFLNRFDGVILFNSLTTEEMEQVTTLRLQAFADKLYKEKKVKLAFTPDAIRAVVAHGYEREFGARSINRYIADVVEDTIVKRLLEGTLAEGAEITFTEADLGG